MYLYITLDLILFIVIIIRTFINSFSFNNLKWKQIFININHINLYLDIFLFHKYKSLLCIMYNNGFFLKFYFNIFFNINNYFCFCMDALEASKEDSDSSLESDDREINTIFI